MLESAAADLLAFTSFPQAHWRKVWSTNPLERLNAERRYLSEDSMAKLQNDPPPAAATKETTSQVHPLVVMRGHQVPAMLQES